MFVICWYYLLLAFPEKLTLLPLSTKKAYAKSGCLERRIYTFKKTLYAYHVTARFWMSELSFFYYCCVLLSCLYSTVGLSQLYN